MARLPDAAGSPTAHDQDMSTRAVRILVSLLAVVLPLTFAAAPDDALTARKAGENQKDF